MLYVSLSTLVIVSVYIIPVCVSAPVKTDNVQGTVNIHRTDRHRRAEHSLGQNERKLAIVMNDRLEHDMNQPALNNRQKRRSPFNTNLSRKKRAVQTGDDTSISRERRTVAMFLSAAIKICDDYRYLCKRVEVEERDVKLTVRLEDM